MATKHEMRYTTACFLPLRLVDRRQDNIYLVFDCAGTWGALLNLAERKGRHTAHTWMDFSIGFFLVSLVCGL